MKILIINPNSDPGMTRKIEEAAQAFAAGEFEVVCGLIIAFGLSRYGVSTSKARRYNPE